MSVECIYEQNNALIACDGFEFVYQRNSERLSKSVVGTHYSL